MILNLYKKRGETPLECMERFRATQPELAGEKMTYAGRLDPLAEGVLVVLTGADVLKKDEYLGLTKEYVFEVLLSFSTDTFDVLGLVTDSKLNFGDVSNSVTQFVKGFPKKFLQEYPAYSSKTVEGKPLFAYAKSGELGDIEMPTKEVEIYSCELLDSRTIVAEKLKTEILESIALVRGDFRQVEIAALWQETFAKIASETQFPIFRFKISCSSGTYVRALASTLGRTISIPALAYKITRPKVGEFDTKNSLH